MNSNNSGKKLEAFFTGKGFYIVLFLCAAVIGVSAWMMATGNETMEQQKNKVGMENRRVETIVIPPEREEKTETVIAQAPELSESDSAATLIEETEPVDVLPQESTQVWHEGDVLTPEAPEYIWPVQGELERSHSTDTLSYDVTLRDWRTHEGLDITAALGSTVAASHSGTVESIEQDDLYGTVVTVSHGDGIHSLYANLASTPAVNVGDWVNSGDVIGAIGTTALCEIGQGTHLHFAMYANGESVDPLAYLPA